MKRRNITIYLAAVLCVCIQLSACKKDKESDTGIAVVGTWKALETGSEAYRIFNSDRTVDILSTTSENRRGISRDNYKLDGDKLNIGGGAISKVEISGDTLILQYSSTNIRKYLKNADMKVEDWVSVISAEKTMSGFFTPALSFNSSDLVLLENSHYMYSKLTFANPIAKNITKTVACTDGYVGLEYANGKYWVARDNDRKLYTVDGNDGSVLTTSVEADDQIRSLAADNTTMYCFTYYNKLFKYNFAAATFDAGTPLFNITLRDVAYRSGYLYLVSDEYIYKVNVSAPQTVVTTYYLKDGYASALAFDGQGNAWIMAGEDQLYKAQLN